jgi:hypothetical protein
MYILIVVTYLGGYAAGPQVSFQELSSLAACSLAKDRTLTMIDGLLQANLQTYRSMQKSASAECVKK